MVIVRIWEGLGNQLFQYAYAWALQKRLAAKVYLDVRHCNKGDLAFEAEDIVKRKLGLQHFTISMKSIHTDKISSLRCLEGRNIIEQINYLLLKQNVGKWKIVDDAESKTVVCAEILNPGDFSYINAHCVHRRYYEEYRDGLLNEYRLKNELILSEKLKYILENKNTVSVHIRLTDYLENPKAVCRQKYYDRAIRYIEDRTDHLHFIVFTDDPHMAKERYKFKDNVYWVYEDGYADYEELMIMSKCHHNIIAGSTFSYWGAWLNQNPGKIVVAPKGMVAERAYERDWKVL